MAANIQKSKAIAQKQRFSGRRQRSSVLMGASKAKVHFLSLVDQISIEESPVTITKRGKPVVQMIPVNVHSHANDIFGCMKGTAKAIGDIVGPEGDPWEALR